MADVLLQDGDGVLFMPGFTPATVVPLPGKLAGSGPATLKGRALCVQGDEAKVEVRGCLYVTPSHPLPGSGTLKIQRLADNQVAQHSRSKGKPLLLQGGSFTASFEVQSPAQLSTPTGPLFDTMKQYTGSGRFMPQGRSHRGT